MLRIFMSSIMCRRSADIGLVIGGSCRGFAGTRNPDRPVGAGGRSPVAKRRRTNLVRRIKNGSVEPYLNGPLLRLTHGSIMYRDPRQWTYIRKLVLEDGYTCRGLARDTGISRKTIRKMLASPHPPCPPPPPKGSEEE